MKKTIFKVIEVPESDRYIFLTIDESKSKEYADGIIGVNFHQCIGKIMWEFKEPDIHVTEIWRRLTLNYPNINHHHLLNKACDMFVHSFIAQDIYK